MSVPLPVVQYDLTSESQFSAYYMSYNFYLLDYENYANCSGNCSSEGHYFSVKDSDNMVKWLFLGVGISVISGLGVLGNIFSIIVLLHSRMRSSISCFLIGLALCDMLILLTIFATLGIPAFLSFEPWSPGELQIYLKVGCFLPWIFGASCTALTGSVYFTLGVTLERYLVVCRPLQARTICTWRRACQAAFFIFFFSVIFSAPKWFEYQCESVSLTKDNRELEGCRVKPTELRKKDYYSYYYVFIANGLVLYYFPMIVLVALNTLIYRKIKEANNNRRILSPSEAKENSITNMLFVVVAIFIICNLLVAAGIIIKVILWNKPYVPSTLGSAIATFLIVLNSSLNFLIYCTYGEKFREVLIYMVGSSWKRLSRKASADSVDSGARIRTESDISNASSTKVRDKRSKKSDSLKTLCENENIC